jgi:manganese/zinc/iron transport system permease protein
MARRAWSPAPLRQTVKRLKGQALVRMEPADRIVLTASGKQAAMEVVRRHRLWETYLITHADVAPAVVDLNADRIEHVLAPDLIRQLEKKLSDRVESDLPPSPHTLSTEKGTI